MISDQDESGKSSGEEGESGQDERIVTSMNINRQDLEQPGDSQTETW